MYFACALSKYNSFPAGWKLQDLFIKEVNGGR
jgi:hypothetical protein